MNSTALSLYFDSLESVFHFIISCPGVLYISRSYFVLKVSLLFFQKLDELVTTETGILFKLIFDSTTDGLSRKGALQCVENICIR